MINLILGILAGSQIFHYQSSLDGFLDRSSAYNTALFLWGINREVFMGKPKIIYCPKCQGRVGYYDGIQHNNVIARCFTCNKRIVYFVDTGKLEIKDVPQRNTASGAVFR